MGNMEKMVLCLITSVFSSMRCHQLRVEVGGKGTEALGEKIWDLIRINVTGFRACLVNPRESLGLQGDQSSQF